MAARGVGAETAFVVRTLLIHEYRKIHLQDPALPGALLPRDWAGAAAYRLCRQLYARVFPRAENHLSACARRLHRPLPPAEAAVRRRFGGLRPR
jgi:phenylacetic acid degradation operon negative regulatory protein